MIFLADMFDGITKPMSMILGGLIIFLIMVIICLAVKIKKHQGNCVRFYCISTHMKDIYKLYLICLIKCIKSYIFAQCKSTDQTYCFCHVAQAEEQNPHRTEVKTIKFHF